MGGGENFVFYSVIIECSKQKSVVLFDKPEAFLILDMSKSRFSMLFTGVCGWKEAFEDAEEYHN